MIVGSYVLHLYCDFCQRPQGRDDEGKQVLGEKFSEGSKQDCYRRARKRGWGINEQKGTAICPTCREEQ